MRWILTLCVLTSASSLGAQETEVPLPLVTLVQPPEVPQLEEPSLSDERIREIEALIDDLQNATRDDVHLNAFYHRVCFVPVGVWDATGEWTEETINASESVRRLIEVGPDAIPYLLENLESDARTNIVIEAYGPFANQRGAMAFNEVLYGNPANPTEQFVLQLNRSFYSNSIHPEGVFLPAELESYRVKVGDVCLVILGQIVGREYECVRNPNPPSLDCEVCSPVHRENIRARLRKIWHTKRPRQKLLESLLLDFSTRGVARESDNLTEWYSSNTFQLEAAKRLLYYYPEVGVPLVVQRIDSFQTTDTGDDDLKNGVLIDWFVDTIAWVKDERIQAALCRLANRTKSNNVIDALNRAGIPADK